MTAFANSDDDKQRWFLITFVAWVLIAGFFIYTRWAQIHWFSLGDTDDNMRLMQVRALLSGQDWYDLHQYRMNPPVGADIHWSRFVDMPLAGIILLLRPFIGGANAEYVSIAVAPLLPLLVAMTGLSLAARRLIGPYAFIISIAVMMFCQGMLSMYMPTRIDHHGWQLALLPWMVAGIADPNRARGGITIAIASALSLVIGVEMVPYMAIAAGVIGLRWIFESGEQPRLRAYGLTLAGATGVGYLVFGSTLNSVPRCDALSPIWLSTVLAGGALLLMLSFVKTPDWRFRLAAAGGCGAIIIGGFVSIWPQCLNALDGISPELYKLWFVHIREVKPITDQSSDVQIALGFSALIGPIGALVAMIRARGTDRFGAWGAVFLSAFVQGHFYSGKAVPGPPCRCSLFPAQPHSVGSSCRKCGPVNPYSSGFSGQSRPLRSFRVLRFRSS
jgi:hypothetical protein